MESTNQFNKGINKDVSPLLQPNGTYSDANNIRIVNDVGGTSFSINNIKGNSLNINIPKTPKFQKITITANVVSNTLTINGETGTAFNTTGMTPEALFNYIVNDGAYTKYQQEYDVYYSDSQLILVPKVQAYPVYYTLTISQTGGGLTIVSSYIPAITGTPEIIGSTNIRDDIYLFVTDNHSLNPGGHSFVPLSIDPSSIGQIWKYAYDKITNAGTLKLIYNNYIDFSTYYCIPPSATLGRYENSDVQRIYWTDNYNKLRSLNVANINSLALDPSILDITPSVDFDVPIMTDLHNDPNNLLKVGAYQMAYRLKNNGGAITAFSELSNLVFITFGSEAGCTGNLHAFRDYVGADLGTANGKLIQWTIKNLDRDYDRIECVVVKRFTVNDPGEVVIISDQPISSDTIVINYNGDPTNETPLTLEEFLALSGLFTHTKTIGSKDNRLFVANVRRQQSDIDFDCRAYQFDSTPNEFALIENGVTNTYVAPGAYTSILEKSDAINPDRTVYKYKANGSTLGGEGLNVSYEFMTIATSAEEDISSFSGTAAFSIPDYTEAPWRYTNPEYATDNVYLGVDSPTNQGGVSPQLYPNVFSFGKIVQGFKFSNISGLLRGYQRNEIYRFGVQFYDKSKNPLFVKWIGDIKMPDFFDVNSNAIFEDGSQSTDTSHNPITDFRLSFIGNNVNSGNAVNQAYVQSLGIKFTISNLESISDKIDGYSIVRVERLADDRTIVNEGYITLPDRYSGSNEFCTTSLLASSAGNVQVYSPGDDDRGFFITPSESWNQTPPQAGQTMNVKGLFSYVNGTNSSSIGGADPYYYWKYYTHNSTALQSATIGDIIHLNYGETGVDAGTGFPVHNWDIDTVTPNDTTSSSIGNAAWWFRLNTTLNNTAISGSTGKFLVTIDRTLSNQYGGNTYTQRSQNQYISCSHFRPIRQTSVPTSDNFDLFGGDIFINMYDSCRWAKNYGSIGRGVSANRLSATFFYPVESVINTDLRHGIYMNYSFRLNFDSAPTELVENYNYNDVYSIENNVRKYLPKPDPFVINEEFDARFWASEIKINGELKDSWGIFLTANYWDCEGIYGPINAMSILKDKMYFWQNRSFGVMEINPRSVVTDVNNPSNANLQLGTGLPLQRHDYISTEVGLQHQWGITKSSYKLFWMDVKNKKFFSYAEGSPVTPDSDIKGMFSYFNNNLKFNINNIDRPVYNSASIGVNGIRSVYDFKYNQAIFTVSDNNNSRLFGDKSFTFTFDESLNCFTSFASYKPKVYITDGYKILSTNPNKLDDMYMHDVGNYSKFYGTLYSSSFKMIVNDNPIVNKVYDNIMYDSQCMVFNIPTQTYTNINDNTWNYIQVYDDYQNTDKQSLVYDVNIKRKERTWNLAIPRNRVLYLSSNSPNIFDPAELSSPNNKLFGERLRDKWIAIEFTYDNFNNYLLSTNNVRCLYRTSDR